MSYGYVTSSRAVMRGPIVSGLTTQLITNTVWGDLDYLILDTPPGTGDVHITLGQEVPLTSAVIVTTPQKLSFVDVIKGIEMYDDLKVPTVAVVQNMSYYQCKKCEELHRIFGPGYTELLKTQFGLKNSFEIPIDDELSKYSDLGTPLVLVHPDQSFLSNLFLEIARGVIEETAKVKDIVRPVVEYSTETRKILYRTAERTREIDGHTLRTNCRCAGCIDEFSGTQLFKPEEVPQDVFPIRIEPKGNYAVAVVWSDGHRSSLYPYAQLDLL